MQRERGQPRSHREFFARHSDAKGESVLDEVITPVIPRPAYIMSSHLPGTCCCESANWPPVEPDSNSAPPRTRVASCIPVFRRLEPVRSPRFCPDRKSFATAARLPPARAHAGRPDSSDCSAPASAAALACKGPLHLRQREHANCLYHSRVSSLSFTKAARLPALPEEDAPRSATRNCPARVSRDRLAIF